MKYLLLTGATGLLGEYLLRDLTRAGVGLAVIARGSGRRSAVERIEDVFRKWEGIDRRGLPRPVVLEGNLHDPLMGLSENAVQWVSEHCDVLLHNAASLQFQFDQKSGEPFRSNEAGTANMLQLLKRAGIRTLHHVSTAYVCGNRRTAIQESDPLDESNAGNDYELSKIRSELLVRQCLKSASIDKLTVYRPAIIVGDHRTGYTSTFHGFYVPLQLASAIRSASPSKQGLPGEILMKSLGLEGNERKNFVPVDWVSAIIARGVTDTQDRFSGRTLHLAPSRRVTVAEMTGAIIEALTDGQTSADVQPANVQPATVPQRESGDRYEVGSSGQSAKGLLEFFRQQMKVYEAYWSDDPEFDCSTTSELAPDLPCPVVDNTSMLRLCRYAMKTNFGARRSPPSPQPTRVAHRAPLICDRQDAKCSHVFGIRVTGPGGGDFNVRLFVNGEYDVCVGYPQQPAAFIHLSRYTYDLLSVGELNFEQAVKRGMIALFDEGIRCDLRDAARAITALSRLSETVKSRELVP